MSIKKKILWGVVVVLVILGGYLLMSKKAVASTTPESFGLQEGNLIRATGDNDIFIINQYGFKRLFLNPAIFNMYGHLNGGWSNVKTVSPAVRDAFVTSPYFRADGDTKVYKLEVIGEDTGILRWVNMSETDFLAQASINQIFTINNTELNWYPRGFSVYAPTHSVVTRTDNFSSALPLTNIDVLKLSVLAVGGDVKLASTSSAFTFSISKYGVVNPLPYTVLVNNEVYASGSWDFTASPSFTPKLSRNGNEVSILQDSSTNVVFKFNFSGSSADRGFKMFLTNPSGTDIESQQFYRESN